MVFGKPGLYPSTRFVDGYTCWILPMLPWVSYTIFAIFLFLNWHIIYPNLATDLALAVLNACKNFVDEVQGHSNVRQYYLKADGLLYISEQQFSIPWTARWKGEFGLTKSASSVRVYFTTSSATNFLLTL